MTISAYRLPPNIEAGASGGPEFTTIIQEAVSGKEQRIPQWSKSRARYDIAYGIRESDDPVGDYKAVLALFYAHLGQVYPFRFKDWSDYQADDDLFGLGDGSTTQFQIGKTYDPSLILLNVPGSITYFRPIYLLVGNPVIKVDGVTKTVTVDYTISNSGLVTFISAPAGPSPAAELTWTGEFDIAVRFDTDYLAVTMEHHAIMEIDSIPIREVLGEV